MLKILLIGCNGKKTDWQYNNFQGSIIVEDFNLNAVLYK
jgi:hypothetical protein